MRNTIMSNTHTYVLSLGVIGEMGSTMVGVLTPFLFDRAPPVRMCSPWINVQYAIHYEIIL